MQCRGRQWRSDRRSPRGDVDSIQETLFVNIGRYFSEAALTTDTCTRQKVRGTCGLTSTSFGAWSGRAAWMLRSTSASGCGASSRIRPCVSETTPTNAGLPNCDLAARLQVDAPPPASLPQMTITFPDAGLGLLKAARGIGCLRLPHLPSSDVLHIKCARPDVVAIGQQHPGI